MNRTVLWILGLLINSSLTHAQVLVPRDFAYGQMALPAEDATAYRLSLPLAVYQNTVQEDLADLRVFNAAGIVVPFSLSRPAAQTASHQAPVALPLFPLHEGARMVIDGVRVTINSPGAAVNLQTQNGSTPVASIGQYILDGRVLDSSMSAFEFAWPETAAEYSGRVRVEASEDLGSWRTVTQGAPIANLRANGQAIIENRVTFSPAKAKFWRLSWLGTAPTFELTSVLAEPADSPLEPLWAALDVVGISDSARPAEYVFDLGAHPPVSRINVLLPDANSVLDVSLSSRRAQQTPWRPVTRAGFYRLKTADGEQQNSPIKIGVDADRYWQARIINGGGLPQSPLRLHVEWIPNEVTFLAEGHAPFLLVYGNASATRAETDLSHLPTTLVVAPATLGSPQALGGPARLIAKPAPYPWTRIALWTVLIFGVMFLAWMARGIAKETDASH
jgi:Protein of unknown function (DUF3999)